MKKLRSRDLKITINSFHFQPSILKRSQSELTDAVILTIINTEFCSSHFMKFWHIILIWKEFHLIGSRSTNQRASLETNLIHQISDKTYLLFRHRYNSIPGAFRYFLSLIRQWKLRRVHEKQAGCGLNDLSGP